MKFSMGGRLGKAVHPLSSVHFRLCLVTIPFIIQVRARCTNPSSRKRTKNQETGTKKNVRMKPLYVTK